MVEGMEQCDGADLAGQTCMSQGFFKGNLACTSACKFDTSGCDNCGNNQINPPEQCDGNDLGGKTCLTQGFMTGMLACTANCSFDTSNCSMPFCGMDPIPPGGACPPQCTSCTADTCNIICNGNSVCANKTLVCPQGWHCNITCSGSSACAIAKVTCPSDYGCNLSCNNSSACASLVMTCSQFGMCGLTCLAGGNVCANAKVTCGFDQCKATCSSPLAKPTLTCGSSCGCTPC